jgi:MFS family permease
MLADRRNVLVLSVSQALMLSAIVLAMTVGAVVGAALAPDKGLATLPIAAMVVGTAATTLPASAFMRRAGRRAGFLCGAALGVIGGLLAALAVYRQSFALFVFAHALMGSYQGFANYYRFAAAEAASPAFASRAISLVIAGGVVAAVLGPQLVNWTRDAFAPHAFAGAYLAQAGLGMLALLALSRLDPLLPRASTEGSGRSLREIARQPVFVVALLGATVGYAVMLLAMTATPLAMLGCGLPVSDAVRAIQWHVLGMFAPSFFTGTLVQRFGAVQVMVAGFGLLVGHVIIAVSGVQFLHFVSALTLLGVGWNFSFIGATALLTRTYRPVEQSKVQAANDFTLFTVVASASLSAGWMYDRFGWQALNLVALAALAFVIALALWFAASRHAPDRAQAESGAP